MGFINHETFVSAECSPVITAEDEYLLQDPANEKKYNFKLSESLRRSKAIRGRLFDKQTFYVTAKVPVAISLLKNVVNAAGGQVCALCVYS